MSSTARDFSENPFKTRADLIRGAIALLAPLEQYKSRQQARIKIHTATGAGFPEQAAQLEGFARPLWVVPHLFLSSSTPEIRSLLQEAGLSLESWIQGLKTGTDPENPEYWGDLHSFDQRMVEMESIAYSLLVAPDIFDFAGDPVAAANLIRWLRQINDHDMPKNNWRWFRVFVNLALNRTLGVPLEDVKGFIESDLALLDSFYLGHGWSSDGLWGDARKQADYYSGSYAIQFAQLLYVRLAPDYDSERTQKYKEQAGEFAVEFWRYFSADGAAVPFGRSMTYRFAMGAFFSAAAAAKIKLPAPLDQPGAIKGMLLRHLRWWSRQHDMFNHDGTLSIGYTYPNMYMSEDYNSPQSVYWCLKSLIVVGIPADDEFWSTPENIHPSQLSPAPHDLALLSEPRHILCNTPEHHFLLSSGQATTVNHKGKEAKYGKFAYSSALAFSVPVGQSLEQAAPDSTLSLSWDEGESWKVHWSPEELGVGSATVGDETVATLTSVWRPHARFSGLAVRTTLIPPVSRHPGWHMRVHEVRRKTGANEDWSSKFWCVDAGFSASAETSNGSSVQGNTLTGQEAWRKDEESALIISRTGASGVLNLSKLVQVQVGTSASATTEGIVIKPHANTNLMMQRTLIPAAKHSVSLGGEAQGGESVITFVTGIFAVDVGAGKSHSEVTDMWHSPPESLSVAGSL